MVASNGCDQVNAEHWSAAGAGGVGVLAADCSAGARGGGGDMMPATTATVSATSAAPNANRSAVRLWGVRVPAAVTCGYLRARRSSSSMTSASTSNGTAPLTRRPLTNIAGVPVTPSASPSYRSASTAS